MDSREKSLPIDYFERKYAGNPDPWDFQTSEYERDKYADTIATLGDNHYLHAFEIGCSIGILTRQLAQRCAELLAVDVVDSALDQARGRCADLDHVAFENMRIPDEFPSGEFDLILLSEVGYFFSRADLQKAAQLMCQHLLPEGDLLLVHYFPYYADHPLSGDEVHDYFLHESPRLGIDHRQGHKTEFYRVDLYTNTKNVRGKGA